MQTRLEAVLVVRPGANGRLTVTVSPVLDDEQFTVRDATLELTTWPEGAELIRARVRHDASGTVAYFQTATKTFAELAAALDLSRRVANQGS